MTGNIDKVRSILLATLLVTSVFAGVVAFSGSAVAADDLEDGQRYWAGQVLVNDTVFASSDTVELHRQTDNGWKFETQIVTDADGSISVDTSGLQTDTYRVVAVGDYSKNITFEISNQTYSAEPDAVTVENDGDAAQTSFTLDSNRVGYDYTVSASGLTASQVQSVLGDTGTLVDTDDDSENDAVKFTNGTTENVLAADFDGIDPGNYTFTFTVVDTGDTASVDVSVGQAAAGNVQVVDTVIIDQRGDVAAVELDVVGTSQGIVQVGSPDAGYTANVSVTDGDDDGTVTLLVNTYAMGNATGHGDAAYSALDSEDSASIVAGENQTQLPSLIDTGDYTITSHAGTDPAGNAQDVGTLTIRQRDTNALNVWTAPQGTTLQSASDVQDAVAEGTLTRDDTIASGDVLVHELDAEGLDGAIAVQNGGSVTERFFALTGGELSLTVTQTNPDKNRMRKQIDLGPDNTTVVADGANDTYYLVTPTESLEANRSGNWVATEAGDRFEANVTVLESGTLASADQSVTAEFELANREVSFDTDANRELSVAAAANQTISGTSTLAAGSTVQVRVNSDDPLEPFLETGKATVGPNGTWSLDLDFSDVPAGTNFTATAHNSAKQLDSVEGQTIGVADIGVSSFDAPSMVTQGENLTVAATVSNTGGTEGTATVEFRFDGDVVESRQVTVAAGDTQTVEFEVTADAEPGTYTHGVYVGDSNATGELEIIEPDTTTTTTPPTTTQPPTTTTTPPTTTQPPTTTTAEPDSPQSGQPGFGIGVALVALVAAALLAVRRQN
ncbi:BGTF surface domain-containing protein [Haloarchaeobius sp. TZWSO28]|uniref:DUF7827 domain-containing protein n=1 Tax=Haloarchaeobius sp. TZWSO28 TaxID=3446119 RepID=UPI003EBC4C90